MGTWSLVLATLEIGPYTYVDCDLSTPCCGGLLLKDRDSNSRSVLKCPTCNRAYPQAGDPTLPPAIRFVRPVEDLTHEKEKYERLEAWLMDLGGFDPLRAVVLRDAIIEIGFAQGLSLNITHTSLRLSPSALAGLGW